MQSLFPMGSPGGFGGLGGFGGASGGASQPIVELRAGKCVIATPVQSNGKHMVTADTRPGKIVLQKEGDGLVHFKWMNAINNQVEDDRMVFAGEYSFTKVRTGREGDRVYVLKYLSGTMRLMFWLQDKSTEKDEELIGKINQCLVNPNLAAENSAEAARAAGSGGGSGPGGLSQEDFMRMMGISPPAGGIMRPPPASQGGGAPSSSTAPSGPGAPFGNLDLSSLLNTIAAQPPSGNNNTQQGSSSEGDGNNGNGGSSSTSAEGDGDGNDANDGDNGSAPMDE